jgi:hypothetical protein
MAQSQNVRGWQTQGTGGPKGDTPPYSEKLIKAVAIGITRR